MATFSRLVLSLLLVSSLTARAQQAAKRLDAVDHAHRMARIALTGDLGLPPLAPLMADSPRDTMYFADRVPVDQGFAPAMAEGGPGQYMNGFLAMGPGGTGTDKNEIFKYMIPGSYDELGPAVPMVIGYHGFGQSADSVAASTTIDEEANARGWFFMSPTGIDDQLYGSPISQVNTEAAVQWMLDNFNIDVDRIYLVGFSMGGGVAANFTARRRDPDGLMIAALGIVSGTMDWTAEYVTGVPGIKTLLINEYNFGGTPSQFPYAYQRASSLYFAAGTYPPLPGLLEYPRSMATNLGSTPVYVTWDINDTIPAVKAEEPVLLGVLASLGGTFVGKPVSGTAVTHSWNVLDEADLFAFFDGKVANRTPAVFEALLDGNTSVSWAHVEQASGGDFSRVSGVALPGLRTVSVSEVANADELHVQVDLAGILGPANVHVAAQSDTGSSFDLQINDLSAPPAWLVDPPTGSLLTTTESDPFEEGLLTPVPGTGMVNVDLVTNADYIADLSTSPEPAPLGGQITLEVDAPDAATSMYLVLGFSQSLSTFKGGHKLLVQLGPSVMILGLPLGPGGQISLLGDIPNDPQLVGMEILLQGIMAAGSSVNSLSNLWRMDIN